MVVKKLILNEKWQCHRVYNKTTNDYSNVFIKHNTIHSIFENIQEDIDGSM